MGKGIGMNELEEKQEDEFQDWLGKAITDRQYTEALKEFISGEEEDECLRKYYKKYILREDEEDVEVQCIMCKYKFTYKKGDIVEKCPMCHDNPFVKTIR